MRVNVSASGFSLTPSIKLYTEEKIGSLDRFLVRFESDGDVDVYVVLSKTTRHHKHGDVFRAVADMRLPGQVLRAEDEDNDVHISVDRVRDRLRQELDKYKTKYSKAERPRNE